MKDEDKNQPSPYFPDSKKIPKTEVKQGQVVPNLFVGYMLDSFKSIHKGQEYDAGELLLYEEVYVQGMVSALLGLNVPTEFVQIIINEWEKQIRENPPDLLKQG